MHGSETIVTTDHFQNFLLSLDLCFDRSQRLRRRETKGTSRGQARILNIYAYAYIIIRGYKYTGSIWAFYPLGLVPLPVALGLISALLTRTLVRDAIRPVLAMPSQVPPPLSG